MANPNHDSKGQFSSGGGGGGFDKNGSPLQSPAAFHAPGPRFPNAVPENHVTSSLSHAKPYNGGRIAGPNGKLSTPTSAQVQEFRDSVAAGAKLAK